MMVETSLRSMRRAARFVFFYVSRMVWNAPRQLTRTARGTDRRLRRCRGSSRAQEQRAEARVHRDEGAAGLAHVAQPDRLPARSRRRVPARSRPARRRPDRSASARCACAMTSRPSTTPPAAERIARRARKAQEAAERHRREAARCAGPFAVDMAVPVAERGTPPGRSRRRRAAWPVPAAAT